MSVGQLRRGVRASSRRRSTGGTPAIRTTAEGNNGATGNNSTSVITVPGTVQNGDVLLVVAEQNTASNTFTISGGGAGVTWVTKNGPDVQASPSETSYLFKARATAGSAGSTITVTARDTSGNLALARFPALLVVAQNATDAGMLTALAQVTSASTSHPFGSVTVPSPGGWLLIGIAALRVNDVVAPTLSGGMPAGAALDDESASAAPAQPNLTVSALHVTSTVAAGSRTPGTATSAATCRSNLYTIALSPA